MRLIRHTALAAGAVALTALAGCGLTSSNADSSAHGTPSTPVASLSTPTAPTQDPTTAETPTAPASAPVATSSAPTSDDAASEPASAPSASSMSSGAGAPVVRYADKTGLLQLPVSNASLPNAPAGLRDFARTRLKQMWHDQFQDAAGCEGIAQVRIKRANAVAAYVEAGWGEMTSTCPQYAGNPGSWEIWGDVGGTWSLVLTGEGLASCADLSSHRIPRVIYPSCSDGSGKVPNPVV